MLPPALEPQMCVERNLDPAMAPSPIIILSNGNLGDVDQQLKHEPSDVSVETRDIKNTEVEANSVKPIQYACELCECTSQTEHGLNVHKGHKHKDVHKTPEKERSTSYKRDISLSLTPSKETREEKCAQMILTNQMKKKKPRKNFSVTNVVYIFVLMHT